MPSKTKTLAAKSPPSYKIVTQTKETTPSPLRPTDEALKAKSTKSKPARHQGKKYLEAKKLINAAESYPLTEAVKLVKKLSFSSFDGKVEAHLTVTQIGNLGEISFPHLETAAKKIVILNDTVLAEIKDGKLNFDILIAAPAAMPKLLPFARLLGPKGLMPNPKNGSLTDKPEEAVKRLSVAKTQIKTEPKAPIVHMVIGRVSQPAAELLQNLQALINTIQPAKIKKLVLCPTMGPGIKVAVEK